MTRKWSFFAAVLAMGVAADVATKQWALAALDYGVPGEAWGGVLKLTLSYNPGAAFGLNLGSASRPIFIVFTFLTLGWLSLIYQRTASDMWVRMLGIALVCAGAVGNLIDRMWSSEGVVDFLGPYDLGFMLWPIFNVADIFVVVGILLLLLSLRAGGLSDRIHDPDALGESRDLH